MSLKARRKEKQEEETDLSALDRFLPLQVSALLSPLDKCRIATSHFPIIAYEDWANNNSSLPVKIISLSYVALGSSSRPLHRFFIPFVKFVWRIKAHFAKASWRLLCGQANNFFFAQDLAITLTMADNLRDEIGRNYECLIEFVTSREDVLTTIKWIPVTFSLFEAVTSFT